MSAEENKAIIRRYREMHNQNKLDHLEEIVSTDLISHSMIPGLPAGPEGGKMAHQIFHSAFPDIQVTTDDLIAEGDKVVERYTASGTNTGSFMEMPATNKKFQTNGVATFRLANGKIVEHWGLDDQFGLMVQLGMIPAPGQPAASHQH